jgi:NAD(P)-dependent dehydrogenase (short-subunit alcohol dehydrogenase family)
MPLALITGTSSGLGRGAAEGLTALGWDVIGTVLEAAHGEGLSFETVVADVTDDSDVARLGDLVRDRGRRLDALVNNAGVAMSGPWEEITAAELRRQLAVNLVGAMAVTGACLPALRAAQISKRSWLMFCDSELEHEFIPVYADSPPPWRG